MRIFNAAFYIVVHADIERCPQLRLIDAGYTIHRHLRHAETFGMVTIDNLTKEVLVLENEYSK